jgi:hypothetical protein
LAGLPQEGLDFTREVVTLHGGERRILFLDRIA